MYDALIIGGGPAGLSAALVLGRARRRVLVIDAGRGRNASARHVNGYLGLVASSPAQLREIGRRQVADVGVEVLDALVTRAEAAADRQSEQTPTLFQIETLEGRVELGRKLLFATGIMDHVPDLPGISECYGRSVHHCPYCDGYEHRDQRLVAIGISAESTARLGMMLTQWSEQVTVLTNGTPVEKDDAARLKRLGLPCHEDQILRIEHEGGQVQSVVLKSGQSIGADAIFFSATSDPCCGIPAQLGCRTKEKGRVETTDRQGTGLPGVFLAGDADGDVEFAIVAAAEGAVAAMAINKELAQEDLRWREQQRERTAI